MKQILFASLLVLAAAASRLFPHPPNFTPLAGIAFVGAVYLDRRIAFGVPLVAMLLSDLIIGFHNLIPFVYASFVLTAGIGWWVRHRKGVITMIAGMLTASALFYLLTNFGVWMGGEGMIYPKSPSGLLECYVAALPFFRNSLLGDAAYGLILIGVFEAAARVSQLQVKTRIKITFMKED